MKQMSRPAAMRLPVLLFLVCCAECSSWPRLEDCDILDLTHAFGDTTVFMPSQTPWSMKTILKGDLNGVYVSLSDFTGPEHGGTHIDAPSHFNKDGISTDRVPFKNLIGEGCVMDIASEGGRDRSYGLTIGDIEKWEAKHGRLDESCVLVIHTGWSKRWGDKKDFLGLDPSAKQTTAVPTFPGITASAAIWLAKNRRIVALGIDTPSIDPNSAHPFSAHVTLAKMGIPNFENLANTHHLTPRGSTIVAMPVKIKGGTGGPLRAFAYGLSSSDPCSRIYQPDRDL